MQFDDGKAPDALRTIGEVSNALGIRQHVLRYWEEQFPTLSPMKRNGGRRYYRASDIELVATIDRLVHREGYTLKGAKKALAGGRASTAAVASTPSVPIALPAGFTSELRAMRDGLPVAGSILPELQAIRENLSAALAQG